MMNARRAPTDVLRSLSFLAVCLVGSRLGAFDASDVLFYHSFDNGPAADFARGKPEPVNQAQPLLADGIVGRGLQIGLRPEHALSFACAGNLDAREGTLAFWVLPVQWNPNAIMRISPAYLNFGGRGVHVLVYTWGVDNDTKFLMQIPGGAHVASLIPSGNWKPGWNHVACTWRREEMVTYHNGVKVQSKGAGSFLLPEEFLGNFNVGGWLGENAQGASSVLDDLYVFRRALAPEEIKLLHRKGLDAAKQAPAVLQAGEVTPNVDGNVDAGEWHHAGIITCPVDRLTGLVDDDPAVTFIGHDTTGLHLAFRYPVPEDVRRQPVFYPRGAFKDDARTRDGNVRDDDCLIFTLLGGDGALYEFDVNPAGAVRDARNGEASYNANLQSAVRADTNAWLMELSIPWSAVGFTAPPKELRFNQRRLWKLLRPGFSELVPGAEDRAFARILLVPGAAPRVSVSSRLAEGELHIEATAPAGKLCVQADQLGLERQVVGTATLEHCFDARASGTADVRLSAADGTPLYRRAIPFAKLAKAHSALTYYPGAGVLVVAVDAVGKREGLSGRVALVDQAGREVASAVPGPFTDSRAVCELDVSNVPPGKYTVQTLLLRDGKPIERNELPFERKPLPAWYGSKAGIVDYVPPPWTDMTITKDGPKVAIGCWGREFLFAESLLPVQVTSRGAALLASPIRIRVRTGGREHEVGPADFTMTEQTVRRCSFAGKASLADGCSIGVQGWIEYDGLLWFDLDLVGTDSKAAVESLFLELPLRPAHATLIYSGSYGGQGTGLLDKKPREVGPWCWVGDADRGIQWCFPSFRGWAYDGLQGKIELIPGDQETVVRFRLIDKPIQLTSARKITLGLHPTPVKPWPKDYALWRFAREGEQRNPEPFRFFGLGAWGWCYPNYPVPKEVVDGKADTPEKRKALADGSLRWQKDMVNGTTCYYMFGPWAWVGSPEYAEWHNHWAHDGPRADPDPHSDAFSGPACHNSGFNDLVASLLEQTVRWYPLRGLYFDCTGAPLCSNKYHGCGYVDDAGVRRPESQILATRRFYERLYTILKAADPQSLLSVHMSGQPHLALYSFSDCLVEGEQFATGLRGVKGTKPQEVNYFDYVGLPLFRAEFAGHNFGVPVVFLPEFAPASGDSPESRRWWYAQDRPMVYVGTAPPGHEAELYEANRAVEHLVGLSLVHDSRLWATYAVMASQYAVWRAQQEFGWGVNVEFVPYWNAGPYLAVEGGMPDKVVVSLYRKQGRTLMVPMNDTDQPVRLRLRPNLPALGIASPAETVKDLYRWQQFEGKTEGGTFLFRGSRDVFRLDGGAIDVQVPPRSFRMLLLEGTPG